MWLIELECQNQCQLIEVLEKGHTWGQGGESELTVYTSFLTA